MLIALFALGCIDDVAKDKVEAIVEDVKPPEAAPVQRAPAAIWTVDKGRSTVTALGAKITAEHPIVFPDFEGQLGVVDGAVTSVNFTVTMNTLQSDQPKLTDHLKTEDFFDVEKFPTSTFASTEVKAGSSEPGMSHTVAGTFTIHGTPKAVTFPANIEASADTVRARTEFALDRKDFGIIYPGRKDDLVQDKVVLTIELVAGKAP